MAQKDEAKSPAVSSNTPTASMTPPELTNDAKDNALKTAILLEYKEPEDLIPGHVMSYDRTNRKYKLVQELNRSSVSWVFKVRAEPVDKTRDEFFAMKIEKIEKADFLRSDLNVMDEVSAMKEKFNELIIQLPYLIDFGKTEKYRSLVMPLYWMNLHDLRMQVLKDKFFTAKSATRLNAQTLNAITALHRLNFIHGNICPRSFMFDKDRHSLRLIDFSSGHFNKRIIREMRTDNIDPIFASRQVLSGEVAKEHDDIESWVFLSFDMLAPAFLRWRSLNLKNNEEIIEAKESFLMKPKAESQQNPKLYDSLPASYRRLCLLFNDVKVDYKRLHKLVNTPLISTKIKVTDPFEWEEAYGQMSKSKDDKKTTESNPKVIGSNKLSSEVQKVEVTQSKEKA
ncbi:CK1/WORM6 protein kinase [Aphelenchoides besseyi]|nr:CK1/WORM6 protein kinase [Aphelenchoides besseyi]